MKKNTIFKYCASLAMGLALCSELSASWTDQIIAGQLGQSGYSGDGGQATSAKLAQPHAVAFDSIGSSLYIADSSNHAVRKVNASGIISTLSMSGLQNPQGICLNSAGKLYVADQDRNVISMYDTATGSFVADFITGIVPQSVCVDGSGNIYIARNFPARVSKYSASGSLINADFITGLVNPKGIWADSSMNIYVADGNANSIGKYTVATSTYNSTFITGLNFPQSVFGDGLGNIYVANSNSNSIMVRSTSGSVSTFISGLNNPQGICVDSSNNVYIADTNGFIVRKLLPPTSLSIDVEGSDSATHSGAITATTLYKTNGGALALSSTSNAIGNLGIHGGKVSVSAASNLNGASSAVTFAASGTDPVSHASNTATLEIAGSMNTGAFAFTSDGTVQVDGSNVATLSAAPTGTGLVRKTGAGVMKVASNLGPQTVTCTFDTDDGYYKNSAAVIAWPSNFTTFSNDLGGHIPSYSGWNTTDTYDHGVSYGGVRLNYYGGPDYTGSPFYYDPDDVMSAAHPTTVMPTPIAGIHVDAGTLYVQSGKAPNAPIQIASGTALKLAGVDESAESEVTSALTVQAGGSIEVNANVKVGSALAVTTTYTFDTANGYYKNGSAVIAWPSNLTGFDNGTAIPGETNGPFSIWLTTDTSDQHRSYGGVSLNFFDPGGFYWATRYVYYSDDATLSAAHPTTTVSTGMDAALSGTVLMQSGSSIVLGAGSTWARNITVGIAS